VTAEALLKAWYTGQITNNEFALAWQLYVHRKFQGVFR
jgi:hypothetical protein